MNTISFPTATKIPGVFFRHDANIVSYGKRVANLTGREADFFAAIWNSYPAPISSDDLMMAVYGADGGDTNRDSMIGVMVYKLRGKLKRIPVAIERDAGHLRVVPTALQASSAGPSWTPAARETLSRLWADATPEELLRAFPGRTMLGVRLQAGVMRLTRRRQPQSAGRCENPLIIDLVHARRKQGLTQMQVAERIGTAQTKVAMWERKGNGFSAFMLQAWCDAVGVELRGMPKIGAERKRA